MAVSPVETIEILAEECRNADGGDARRNIIDFLEKYSAAQRAELLYSGKNLKVEDTFSREFERLIKSASEPGEAIAIVRMLIPLSTISGKNARREDAARFTKVIAEAVSSNAPANAREEIIEVFDEFLSRNPPVDPREILRFYGVHGRTFAKMALDGKSKGVMRQVEMLKKVVSEALELWRRGSNEPDESKIAPNFCRAILSRTLVSLGNHLPEWHSLTS
jgi:hypothetical protein